MDKIVIFNVQSTKMVKSVVSYSRWILTSCWGHIRWMKHHCISSQLQSLDFNVLSTAQGHLRRLKPCHIRVKHNSSNHKSGESNTVISGSNTIYQTIIQENQTLSYQRSNTIYQTISQEAQTLLHQSSRIDQSVSKENQRPSYQCQTQWIKLSVKIWYTVHVTCLC